MRLQHLKDIGPAPKEHVLDWNRKRLPLMLADHLLRSGYRDTASFLVEARHLQVNYHLTSAFTVLFDIASQKSHPRGCLMCGHTSSRN